GRVGDRGNACDRRARQSSSHRPPSTVHRPPGPAVVFPPSTVHCPPSTAWGGEMRILDRERYWAFFKASVICFIALVGLYVVIDAFANLDEFSEVAGGVTLFRNMGRYYLVKLSLFYDRLCGVIVMMAAIFTVTWMQ